MERQECNPLKGSANPCPTCRKANGEVEITRILRHSSLPGLVVEFVDQHPIYTSGGWLSMLAGIARAS